MGKKVKMKTNKSMAKRIKVSGSGRLMRYRSGRGHNTGKKSKSRLRRLRKPAMVSKSHVDHVKRALGM